MQILLCSCVLLLDLFDPVQPLYYEHEDRPPHFKLLNTQIVTESCYIFVLSATS